MATSDPFRPSTASVGETGAGLKDKAADLASQAREKASDMGSRAADAIDSGLHSAGHKLKDTAASLRGTAESGSSHLSEVTGRVASGLEAAGQYMHDTRTRDLMSGIEQTVRRNPGPSLVIAAAIGFLLGSALRSNDS